MKLISFLMAFLFVTQAFAVTITTNDGTVCDFSKITQNSDGTYNYSAGLNSCVGKLVQDNATQKIQIADLYKAVDQYKMTIQTDEQRIQNLMISMSQVQERVDKAASLQQNNDKLAFGLGVLTAFLAAEAAAKLSGR
jgi:hypothetical protein